jgi:hypothetical protein
MRLNGIAATTAALTLTALSVFAQGSHTLTGTVSDSLCGKTHSMGGSAAECTRACVKGGASYVLVAGDKIYTLKGDKTAIDKFAGASATVTGTTNGSVLTVSSIKAAK